MKVLSTLAEKLLPWMVKVLFYGLKTIGLAPLSIQFRTRAGNSRHTSIKVFLFSRMGLLYNLVLATVIQIVGALEISSTSFLEYLNFLPINIFLGLITHILPIFTSSFIVVYLAFRQTKAAIIMNRLLDVHFLLSGVGIKLFNKRRCIFSSLQIALYVLLWFSAITLDVFLNLSLNLVVCNAIPIIFHLFFIEYSIILGVVVRELEILNKNLLNLNDFSSYSFRSSLPHEHLAALSSPTRSQLATLKLLHSIRTTLFELSQDIAELFSLPILLSVACTFMSLVRTSFFLVTLISVPISVVPVIFRINIATSILRSVFPLFSLASNVTEISKEANRTGQIVHTLLATANHPEIKTELEQFSRHLMHEDLSFTAHGFFALDFTLLQSIFGATVTYLVIVLQFVQSDNDHH